MAKKIPDKLIGDDHIKDMIRDLLKNGLSLNVRSASDYYSSGFKIEILFDGEAIDSAYFDLPSSKCDHDRY